MTVKRGFVFTELVPDDYVPEFEIGMSEKDFDKKLYPVINWSDDEMKKRSADSYVRYTLTVNTQCYKRYLLTILTTQHTSLLLIQRVKRLCI